MITEENIFFDDDMPDSIKERIYAIAIQRLSLLNVSDDKIFFISPMSAINAYGKIFFKTYILNSYEEKYNLENKPNFLFFVSHAEIYN